MINEIIAALLLSNPKDLAVIRKYIAWMKIRRAVNDRFYFRAHWVQKTAPQLSARRVHWI